MFWKRSKDKETTTPQNGKVPKTERLSPKEIMERKIKQIGAAQSLTYPLSKNYGNGSMIAIVELNPDSSEQAKKYILSVDTCLNGVACGGKTRIMQSDDHDDIANWIWKRKGDIQASQN